MKALITGITGFVGYYLANELLQQKDWEVWGTSRSSILDSSLQNRVKLIDVDFSNIQSIKKCLDHIKPDYIYHLAGQSNVKLSWDNKLLTYDSNVANTLNLLEGARLSSIGERVKILTVGSSEEYGLVPKDKLPIGEETILNPQNPYGITKAAVGMMVNQFYKAYRLNVVHVRPFNHIGPKQSLGFVTSDFAKQVAEIEAGIKENTLVVGNLSSERDFLDVRDIVKAYVKVLELGKSGEIYNICRGKATSISSILQYFISQISVPVHVEISKDLYRPVDLPLYIGSNKKIVEATGWSPVIELENSLADILNYWRGNIRK